MENLKKIKFEDCNLMVYVKTKNKFEPLSSLQNLTFAPNLMYACLIPFEKLETLKNWANSQADLFIKYNYSLQIRSSKDRKKVLYQIN
jgi:hypothetical protein